MIGVDMRPLAARQREIEDKLDKLDPKVAATLRTKLRDDSLTWSIVPLILKREMWELFWSVYRDSVEQSANKMLTMQEEAKSEKPSMFSGFKD